MSLLYCPSAFLQWVDNEKTVEAKELINKLKDNWNENARKSFYYKEQKKTFKRCKNANYFVNFIKVTLLILKWICLMVQTLKKMNFRLVHNISAAQF